MVPPTCHRPQTRLSCRLVRKSVVSPPLLLLASVPPVLVVLPLRPGCPVTPGTPTKGTPPGEVRGSPAETSVAVDSLCPHSSPSFTPSPPCWFYSLSVVHRSFRTLFPTRTPEYGP